MTSFEQLLSFLLIYTSWRMVLESKVASNLGYVVFDEIYHAHWCASDIAQATYAWSGWLQGQLKCSWMYLLLCGAAPLRCAVCQQDMAFVKMNGQGHLKCLPYLLLLFRWTCSVDTGFRFLWVKRCKTFEGKLLVVTELVAVGTQWI